MAVIIDQLVNKLKDAAYDEIKFQLGSNDTVLEEITNRLKAFQGLVEYASEQKQDNSLAKQRVKQLRETAIYIEDVLDEFMLEMELLEINKPSNFCEVKNIGACMLYHIKKAYRRFQFHQQLNVINKKLEFQEGEQEKYQRLTVSQQGKSVPVGSHRRTENVNVVGRENELAELLDLVEQPRDEMKVITVWGPGGSGKTTLVKKVYERVEMNKEINCCAWVSVKQSSPIDVLKSMVKITNDQVVQRTNNDQVQVSLDNLSVRDLQEQICNNLKHKRYVVILDDVWDAKVLEHIPQLIEEQSSIVVTSRVKTITEGFSHEVGVGHTVLEVKPLNPDLSWELFCKVAFPNNIPPNDSIKTLGEQLVNRCDGLPLAILAIAGLMARKGDNPSEWHQILQSLDSILQVELAPLNRALLLSYYHLPPHLKLCFLYCAMFHKSDDISVRKLIRLWIAEGFVNKGGGGSSTLENIARGYFNELIESSMLQFGDESRGFQMHDLLRDVAVHMIAEENFGVLLKQEMIELDSNQRRLVISDMVKPKVRLGTCKLKLRTLIARYREQFYSSLSEMLQNIKLIRTLDLVGATHIKNVPDELGDLIHLTYLSLRWTSISDLPDSIKKLRHLQTLDVRNNWDMEHVPTWIADLKQLRHLLMERHGILGDYLIMPDITFKFAQLQTLSGVHLNLNQAMELKSTTQLTKLNISATGKESWRKIYDAIRMMRNLRTLKLKEGFGSPEVLQVVNLPVPPCLEKLTLVSFDGLPNGIVSHSCLREITLSIGCLFEDGFITLGQLPSLKVLKLDGGYQGEQLICEPDSFPKLEEFEISYPNYFTTWNQIPKGSMKCLRKLSICNCDKLRMLPDGLQELQNLQMLNLLWMPNKFLQRIDIGGPDYSKIQRIPRIQQRAFPH